LPHNERGPREPGVLPYRIAAKLPSTDISKKCHYYIFMMHARHSRCQTHPSRTTHLLKGVLRRTSGDVLVQVPCLLSCRLGCNRFWVKIDVQISAHRELARLARRRAYPIRPIRLAVAMWRNRADDSEEHLETAKSKNGYSWKLSDNADWVGLIAAAALARNLIM
jgi:hypothetical protein